MNQTVLVCDNSSFACDLSVSLRARGASVFLLVPPEQMNGTNETAVSDSSHAMLVWNRPSALSARTIVVALKNRSEGKSQSVFVLDGPDLIRTILANKKDSASDVAFTAETASLIDEYIRGLYLLVSEIAKCYREKGAGRLVFILKPVDTASSFLVAGMIESAFIRLADEITKDFASTGLLSLQSMLIKIEDNEKEDVLSWTVERILSYGSERTVTRWIKAGSKGLFGKF